jgi:hypothetical protein
VDGLLEAVFSVGSAPKLYSNMTPGRLSAVFRVEAGSNLSTVALRVVGGDEKGLSAWRYKRATLFLGDINTGTWPSRLGESQI